MKSRCGFYSKLHCEGVVEEFGGGKLERGGELLPPLSR